MNLLEFDKFARTELNKYMLGLGIYPNAVCYQSLIECVMEAAYTKELAGRLCEIYIKVARKLGKTPSAIERGVRCGLNKCMTENRMDTLNEYFGYYVYRRNLSLRNGEVISLLASKITEDYENCCKLPVSID